MIGSEIGAQHGFDMVPESFTGIRTYVARIVDGKVVSVIGAIAVRVVGLSPLRRHVLEIVMG